MTEPSPLEAAQKLLISAAIGSCTCNTKSPELFWHEPNCRYVTIMMALENVERAAEPADEEHGPPNWRTWNGAVLDAGKRQAPDNDHVFAIHDALTKANLEYSGYSCNGVNLFGDKKSIEAATRAFHSHSQIDWYQRNLRHWREECGKLHAKLAIQNSRLSDLANVPEATALPPSDQDTPTVHRGTEA